MKKYLGIDIGGTAIKYALLNEAGEIIEKGETPTPKDTLESLMNSLDSFISQYKDVISGIGMSAPGRIDNKRGYFYTGGALSHYLSEVPLGDMLSEKYSLPVAIDNDAKCAANAELWLGALKDVNSGVVVILGTGNGGGIVLDKKVWRGINGAAGEISNLPYDYNGLYENKLWAKINGVYGLVAPYAAKKELPLEEANGRIFFEALHNGDEDAKEVFDQFIKTLVAGIVCMQVVLDVDKFCIGGGISAQDILIDTLRDEVKKFFDSAEHFPCILPEIDRCQFKNDANIIGAINNFFEVHGH